MKLYKYISIVALLLAGCLVSCSDDSDEFGNQLYNDDYKELNTTLIGVDGDVVVRSLSVAMAKTENEVVNVRYGVDPTLVDLYNSKFDDEALLLSEEYYEFPEDKVEIRPGGVKSNSVDITFKDISSMERESVYVLPVTIKHSDIKVLESKKTSYFVFKGGALINVVADMEDKNFMTPSWANSGVVSNLTQFTLEALINARSFETEITTIMGIEGYFLIRIGDAGFPSNQIQIATSGGNFPAGDSKKGLPTNQWVHIAVTYDASDNSVIIYVDGKKQSEGNVGRFSSVSLANNFHIGFSYNSGRELDGMFSECRIWNTIRTQEEIANNPYFVNPDSEGLVSYWRCNEGGGSEIKDHTANGNHAMAARDVKWVPVTLP